MISISDTPKFVHRDIPFFPLASAYSRGRSEIFAYTDTNGDGEISADEYAVFAKEMVANTHYEEFKSHMTSFLPGKFEIVDGDRLSLVESSPEMEEIARKHAEKAMNIIVEKFWGEYTLWMGHVNTSSRY